MSRSVATSNISSQKSSLSHSECYWDFLKQVLASSGCSLVICCFLLSPFDKPYTQETSGRQMHLLTSRKESNANLCFQCQCFTAFKLMLILLFYLCFTQQFFRVELSIILETVVSQCTETLLLRYCCMYFLCLCRTARPWLPVELLSL